MYRIIPQETYKYISAKLHRYEEIKLEIEEWRVSVQHRESRERIPGCGYVSDPTANRRYGLQSRRSTSERK